MGGDRAAGGTRGLAAAEPGTVAAAARARARRRVPQDAGTLERIPHHDRAPHLLRVGQDDRATPALDDPAHQAVRHPRAVLHDHARDPPVGKRRCGRVSIVEHSQPNATRRNRCAAVRPASRCTSFVGARTTVRNADLLAA